HKPYPSCRFVHSSLDAVIGLIADGLVDATQIERITTSMSSTGRYIVDDPEPWTEGKGTMGPRFSAQFNIAVAALHGRRGLEDIYDPEVAQQYLSREEVLHLMSRIDVQSDPSIDQNPDDFWKCDLEVRLHDGRVERRVVQYPLGEPENDLGTDGLVARFIKMTTMAGFWDALRAELAAAELLRVDELPDAGVLPRLYA
ncbi:MAG: hypothetical protein VB093_12010, partial [Propionicimonas sp.]|nr:hypothetical protein [Propionicimonas sp.]